MFSAKRTVGAVKKKSKQYKSQTRFIFAIRRNILISIIITIMFYPLSRSQNFRNKFSTAETSFAQHELWLAQRASSTIANKVYVRGIQRVERVAAGLGRECLSFHMACPVVLHSTHVTRHYYASLPFSVRAYSHLSHLVLL